MAVLHDHHAVCKTPHQIQVMGNQQHGHAIFGLQGRQQVKNLPAQGNIQRGGGLVSQQQLRLTGQCHGNHGALALPATELVRKRLGSAGGLGHARLSNQGHCRLFGLHGGQTTLERQDFGNLLSHRVQRVERSHRLLKNHGDVLATYGTQRRLGQGQ